MIWLCTLMLLLVQEEGPLSPPGVFHGNWRMTLSVDRADHGLMAVSIQLGRDERDGTGDYAAHQPFCDFLAGGPLRGDSACEITGGSFQSVRRTRQTLVLTLTPTADGALHRIVLVRRGKLLAGRYRSDGFDRAVTLEPMP